MSKQKSLHKVALDELHQYLSGFAALTKAEFGLILPYIEFREFDKKVQVLAEGEVEKYLNIVARGLVRKYVLIKNKEIIIQLAAEGHLVNSEFSFFTREPSRSVIETIEPTVFLSISHDNLQQLYEVFPKVEHLGRLMVTDLFVKKDIRYFKQLQKNTRERFLEYIQNHPDMLQRVPQKYIASYLNIKPETFSRLKHYVRKKGD